MCNYFDHLIEMVLEAEGLGTHTLSNGVRLIGHIPHLAPEAYLHVLYPPLNEPQIATIEEEIQRPLPMPLRDFYKRSNGMNLFADALSIDGLRDSYARTGDEAWQPFGLDVANVKERPAGTPESFVFFGGYEWDGSLLGMFPDEPAVHLCAPQSAETVRQWPSLGTMLISEADRLRLLFDESGRKIDDSARTTPG